MSDFVTLDGYTVRRVTEKAIGITKTNQPLDELIWLPRSLCEEGDRLEQGDTDISVKEFKAQELDLDY